jgi:lysophospholipase L1-like esterase
MAISVTRQTRLLFIGDSITDCGRSTDSEKVGHGYVRIIRDWLAARDPASCPHIINVGTSGNKMPDLQSRWQRDVIEHAPNVVSVKIGINDVWHGLQAERGGCAIEPFIAGYRDILSRLQSALPGCAVVLCEPSLIDPPQDPRGNESLQPYVRAVHRLAQDFRAECVVPLHTSFVKARSARPDLQWTTDGVHPTDLGHVLIARTWLATVGLL